MSQRCHIDTRRSHSAPASRAVELAMVGCSFDTFRCAMRSQCADRVARAPETLVFRVHVPKLENSSFSTKLCVIVSNVLPRKQAPRRAVVGQIAESGQQKVRRGSESGGRHGWDADGHVGQVSIIIYFAECTAKEKESRDKRVQRNPTKESEKKENYSRGND